MIRERAFAKVNLLLHIGPARDDGLHEISSLFASVDLADELRIEAAERGGDVVVCPGVQGPNLVESALRAFRSATDAPLPPLRVTVEKRIPVAAGLGGGSADAAAILRAANEIAGRPFAMDDLRAIGAGIGADVPSQVEPRSALVTGAGEHVEPLPLQALPLVLVPQAEGLSTARVFAEADRIGAGRRRLDPGAMRELAGASVEHLAAALENDLQAAALSLRPDLQRPLSALRGAGALTALVTGSGPTVFGLFGGPGAAERAAREIPDSLLSMVRTS